MLTVMVNFCVLSSYGKYILYVNIPFIQRRKCVGGGEGSGKSDLFLIECSSNCTETSSNLDCRLNFQYFKWGGQLMKYVQVKDGVILNS